MQLYDATNKRGLCQKIDRLCDTDDTSYPRLAKTAELNDALERVISWIIKCDGRWQWDDMNRADLPIGTQALVEGQTAYTFNDRFLQLLEVKILDLNGTYVRIDPFDPSEMGGSVESKFGTTKGFPQYYDKISDDTIKLYPSPTATSCTLAAGIKIVFKRTASLFTPVDTTVDDSTEPGFASPFHEILAYMASISYCMTYKKDRVAMYEQKVGDIDPNHPIGIKAAIIEHYSQREKDTRNIMTMAQRAFR